MAVGVFSTPFCGSLDDFVGSIGDIPSSWCCIMGNEAVGISKEVVAASTKSIRIDMVEGVDSLSVPIATGILLHGLKERES